MKRALGVVGAALVGAALLAVVASNDGEHGLIVVPEQITVVEEARSPVNILPAETEAEAPGAVRPHAEEPLPAVPPTTQQPSRRTARPGAPARDTRVELAGTLSVVDLDGTVLRVCRTGSFVLAALPAEGRIHDEDRVTVHVEGGVWTCRIQPYERLRVFAVRGDDENLTLERNLTGNEHFDFPTTGTLDVEALRADNTRLRGTMILVDGRSGEELGPAGEATFRLRSMLDEEEDGPTTTVEVRDGSWSASIRAGRYVRADEIEVDGRSAFMWPFERFLWRDPDPIPVTGDEVRLLVAHPPTQLVHVLDEEGEPLNDVAVKQGWNPYLPGEDPLIAEGVASPVDLALLERESITHLWAGAPGRAWIRISVDDPTGGEQTVWLPRAGNVEFTFDNLAEVQGFKKVTLSGPRSLQKGAAPNWKSSTYKTTIADDRIDRSPFTYASLPVGDYEVEVTVNKVPVHSAPLEIVTGQTVFHRAILVQPEVVEPEKAPLEGTLSIAPEWGPFRLRIERLDERGVTGVEIEAVDESAGTWRWRADAQPLGRYRAVVFVEPELSVKTVVEAGALGNLGGGPDPATAVLTLTTPGGELVTDLDGLEWKTHYAAPLSSRGDVRLVEDHFELTAPAGEIWLRCYDHRFEEWKPLLSLQPGPNRANLEIRPSFGFAVTLESDTGVVAPSFPHMLRAKTPAEEVVRFTDVQIVDGCWYLSVGEPGPYLLEFWRHPPDGYELAEPVRAIAVESERVPVTLRLVRQF